MAFKCPVCACIGYNRVVVLRPNGRRYETSFFACSNCTAMFLDPDRFTVDRAPKVVPLAPDFRLLWPKRGASKGAKACAGTGGPRQRGKAR